MSQLSRKFLPGADEEAHSQFDLVYAAAEVLLRPRRRRTNTPATSNSRSVVDPLTEMNAALTSKLAGYGARCDIGAVAKSYIAYTKLQVLCGEPISSPSTPDHDVLLQQQKEAVNELLGRLGAFLKERSAAGQPLDALAFLQQEIRQLSP